MFEQILTHASSISVEKSMVSAPIKANASMDSPDLKVPEEQLDSCLQKLCYKSRSDRKAKVNKAPKNHLS